MNKLIPLNFKNERVITTELLADVYKTDINNIQANFKNHKGNFQEGKHYYLIQGNELRELKNQLNDIQTPINKFTSSLYLWTERGANRHCKILDTDKAWEQFDNLEETYFNVKENTPKIDNLSPQLQLLINMELKQRQLEETVQETKEDVQAIRDVITLNPNAAWRRESNRILNAIGVKGGDFKSPKENVYNALKERGKCRPNVLVANLKNRALINGTAPSKVEKLNILDVLENEPRLKEIYVNIVKELAIKENIRL